MEPAPFQTRIIQILAASALAFAPLSPAARADDDSSLAKAVQCYKAIGRFTETDSKGVPFVAKASQGKTMKINSHLTASLVTNEFLIASPDRLDRPGVFWVRGDGIYFYPLSDSRGVPQAQGQFYLNYPEGDASEQLVVTVAQGRVVTQSKAKPPGSYSIAGTMNTEAYSRQVVNDDLQRRLRLVSGVVANNTSIFVNGLYRRKNLPDDFVRTGLDRAQQEYQQGLAANPSPRDQARLQANHTREVEQVASQKLESDFNPDLSTFMAAIRRCESVDGQGPHLTAQNIDNTVEPYAGPLTAYAANAGSNGGKKAANVKAGPNVSKP